jgi:transposase-like protein
MKQKRRNHSPEFKARVALEAIRGVKTVQQIAADNHLHPVQVTQWKTQMLEAAPGVFERGRSAAKQQLFWFSVNWKNQVEALRSGRVGFGV